MFIQTEATHDANRMRFLPGRAVYPDGVLAFASAAEAKRSPLASRLFGIEEVRAVEFGPDSVTITKADEAEWLQLKPAVLGAIMDHFVAGIPVLLEDVPAPEGAVDLPLDENDAIVGEIRELIETRIRPAAVQGGGDIQLRGWRDGIVYLEMQGPAFRLKAGIENMLRHYVPEVEGVADWRDARPKPGLRTPEGQAIRELLDRVINPQVASHGGHISLVDVEVPRAYIRMEGGCQGCGMANVTLKQGVEVQIKEAVPAIREVLDVTEHADGTNPYYQPA